MGGNWVGYSEQYLAIHYYQLIIYFNRGVVRVAPAECILMVGDVDCRPCGKNWQWVHNELQYYYDKQLKVDTSVLHSGKLAFDV